MFCKRIIAMVLLVIFMIHPVIVYAGIQEQVNDMFSKFGFRTNINMPGAYIAQTQGMIAGGSMSMRAEANTPIWLLKVQPPKLNAGCGGVDMFFGGLSFPSHQQFINMMKSIGTGVIGYAFKMALKVVCEQCASTLNDIENLARQLNRLQTDSCYAARAITGAAFANLGESAVSSCFEHRKSQDGGFLNDVDAYQQCGDADVAKEYINRKGADAQRASEPGSTTAGTQSEVKTYKCGVSIWQGLKFANGLSHDEKILIMNLVGTYALPKAGELPRWYPKMISIQEFINGFQDKAVYGITTDSEGCDQIIDPSEMGSQGIPPYTLTIYPGFKIKIQEKIESIVAKIESRSSLSQEEKDFLDAMPVPLYTLARETRNSKALLNIAIDLTSEAMAMSMAYATVRRYVDAAERASVKQQQVPPENVRAGIESAKTELHREMQKANDVLAGAMKTYELTAFFIGQIRQNASHLLAASSRTK